MTDYRIEAPAIIRDFLTYHETIQGHSQKTVDEYYLDLRNFFRYIKLEKGCVPRSTELDDISIEDVNLELIRSVRLSDIYAYMSFLSRDRVRNARRPDSGHGLQASTRARKVATIRSFYKYLTNKAKLLTENPNHFPAISLWKKASSFWKVWTGKMRSGISASSRCF